MAYVIGRTTIRTAYVIGKVTIRTAYVIDRVTIGMAYVIGRVTIRIAYVIGRVTISYHNYHKPKTQYRFIFHTDNKITIRLIFKLSYLPLTMLGKLVLTYQQTDKII